MSGKEERAPCNIVNGHVCACLDLYFLELLQLGREATRSEDHGYEPQLVLSSAYALLLGRRAIVMLTRYPNVECRPLCILAES